MLITVRGRVEADPLWVPAPASLSTGRSEAFETVLQERLESDRPAPGQTKPERKEEAAVAEPAETPAQAAAEDVRESDEDAPVGETTDEAAPSHFAHTQTATDTVADHETPRRGETVRQETAGKGADSPRRATSPAGEQVLATVLQQATPQVTATPIAGTQSVGAIGAAKAASAAGPVRAIAPEAALPQTPTRAATVTAGYRTSATASAQMLDQARDSVFKQILLKLDGEGGELRMRLEPPNLGELDLLLTVEQGNKLHLAIRAERTDLADMLQRHLDELTTTLQNAGLQVAGAHIDARGEGARRDLRDTDFGGASTDEADDIRTEKGPRFGGFVSAEGLDFLA
jgi:flagellar hook-length control protein FliK